MRGDYRVLQGFFPSAGQPALLAQGLRRQGVDAVSVVVGANRFGYEPDIRIEAVSRDVMQNVLAGLCPSFDIIHMHARTPFFQKGTVRFPMGWDILALKAAGKKVVIHFRGTEVRLPSIFNKVNPFSSAIDDPDGLFAKWPEESMEAYLELCRATADLILVPDQELKTFVPEAGILERAIDRSVWQHVGLLRHHCPLIIHAPSRRGSKGTDALLHAVETLAAEGLSFEFRMVEGLPNNEARLLYEQADIIVDQLRAGWYGVISVEAMALGKAVVAYIRDDLLATFPDGPPVAVANPHTATEVLRRLIQSPDYRQQVAAAGHRFCASTHDVNVVAAKCAAIYDDLITQPPRLDFDLCMKAVARQQAQHSELVRAARVQGVPPTRVDLEKPVELPAVASNVARTRHSGRYIATAFRIAKAEGYPALFRKALRKVLRSSKG